MTPDRQLLLTFLLWLLAHPADFAAALAGDLALGELVELFERRAER